MSKIKVYITLMRISCTHKTRLIASIARIELTRFFPARAQQQLWNAANAKAASCNKHAVMQYPVKGSSGVWINLVHGVLVRLFCSF